MWSLFSVLAGALLASAFVVVDGDTFHWRGETIRIATIDAPESGGRAKCDAERRLARLATLRLVALLAGGRILVVPGDPASGRIRDRWGRILAVVTVDGRDIGRVLVDEGLARPWTGRRRPWCL